MVKVIGIIITSGFLLTACEQNKQLKEMHDNTAQMNNTTSDMNETMKKMSTTTNDMHDTMIEMKDTTQSVAKTSEDMGAQMKTVVATSKDTYTLMGELLDSSRQGVAHKDRMDTFEKVVKEKALDKKIVNAAQYFEGFDFQFWSGQGQDVREGSREDLIKMAITELLKNAKTFSHWDDDANDPFANPEIPLLNALPYTQDKAVFNALAATLHKVNPKQEINVAQLKIKKMTMFSVIQESLLAGQLIDRGEKSIADFPVYVDEVLRDRDLCIRLLKARYDMMGVVLLGEISPLQGNLIKKANVMLDFFGLNPWSRWNFQLDRASLSQINYYLLILNEAKNTKNLLTQLGYKVQVNEKIQKIFLNVNIKQSKNRTPERIDVEQNLLGQLMSYVGLRLNAPK